MGCLLSVERAAHNGTMEYRKLPPPDPHADEKMLKILDEVALIRARVLAWRGGVPFEVCEIDDALREVRAGE